MKQKTIKGITGGKKQYQVKFSNLSSNGVESTFYNDAIPELWSLKLKARKRMDKIETLVAVNQ